MAMQEFIHILFGFDAPIIESEIHKLLEMKGYRVETAAKYTKVNIQEYLITHTECSTVILKETMGNIVYTAEELAMLSDERDVNVIVVLNGEHKGTSYMQTLYAAGITNAIFQEGKHGGATAKDLAELIVRKRTRKETREYYGIATLDVDIGILSYDAFKYYYGALFDENCGGTLIERYLYVASKLTPKQNEDFLRRLNKSIIDELIQYEEFHRILAILKEYGIDLKIKKPKKLKIATVTPPQTTMITEKERDMNDKYENTNETGSFDFGFVSQGDDEQSAAASEEEQGDAEYSDEQVQEPVTQDTKPIEIEYTENKKSKIWIVIIPIVLIILILIGLFIGKCVKNKGFDWFTGFFKNTQQTVSSEDGSSEEKPSESDSVVSEEVSESESENESEETSSEKEDDLEFASEDSESSSVPSETVIANPDTLDSEYGDLSAFLIDGAVLNGIAVVNVINAHEGVRFRVCTNYGGEQLIYVNGGASVSDISADANFKVSVVEGEYIFTEVE